MAQPFPIGPPLRGVPGIALPDGVRACVLPFGTPPAALHRLSLTVPAHGVVTADLPDSLRGAVAKRQGEHLAGRLAARLALADLGLSPATEVPIGPDRAPVWPPGIAGSIAHGAGLAVAVAARAGQWAGLGVDCETLMTDARADPLARTILSPSDDAHCPPVLGPGAFVTLVFAAKEALYKAVHPRHGRIFGFHAARVTHLDDRGIGLALGPDMGAFAGRAFTAHWAIDGDRVLTLVCDRAI